MRRVGSSACRSSVCLSRPTRFLPSMKAPEHMAPRWLSTQPTDSGESNGEGANPPTTDSSPAEEASSPTPSFSNASVSNELKQNLRPSEVVKELDRHIVGQPDAKRAVAIAMRNRWRRRQLPEDLRKEVTPRNVLLVGPTGCGKVSTRLRFKNFIYYSRGCLLSKIDLVFSGIDRGCSTDGHDE